MLNNIRDIWLISLVGIVTGIVVCAYGIFCWNCVQTVRAQESSLASLKIVPLGKVRERVITQSLDDNGAVIGQSIKNVVRERYIFKADN